MDFVHGMKFQILNTSFVFKVKNNYFQKNVWGYLGLILLQLSLKTSGPMSEFANICYIGI